MVDTSLVRMHIDVMFRTRNEEAGMGMKMDQFNCYLVKNLAWGM